MNMPSLLIERKIEIHPIHLVSSEGMRQKHVGNYRSVTNNRKFYSEIKNLFAYELSCEVLDVEYIYSYFNGSGEAELSAGARQHWNIPF